MITKNIKKLSIKSIDLSKYKIIRKI